MKHFSTFLFVLSANTAVHAQSECADGRYTDYLRFDSVIVTSAVPFGANTPVAGGGSQILYMDVYQPYGDVLPERPAVVVTYGGSFIAGTRADVAEACRIFAHLGYVVVAPDYRVGLFFPNAHTTELAVIRCMHDMRACVRYLRKTIEVEGNPYHIDTDRIIVGGVSAGGIGAVHLTYLDQVSEIPAALYGDTASIGGLEGNSGSPGYSSDVIGCFSMSGAIGDTSWIQPGDQPLCSLHEVGDPTVPYGTQEVSVIGVPTGLIASGSADIHKRLDHVGVPNCFLSYPGNQHVGYLNYDPVNSMDFVVQFLANVVCGDDANCGTLYAGIEENTSADALSAFPNPTDGALFVKLSERSVVTVLDAEGRALMQQRADVGLLKMDLSALPQGLYLVRCVGEQVRMARVVKN